MKSNLLSSSTSCQGARKRKFSQEDYEWHPSGHKNCIEEESNYSSDSSDTFSTPSEFSYRSDVHPKTRRNQENLGAHSFDFVSKIQSRIDMESLEGFIKAQCRICGISRKKCFNIFESGKEISRVINTYLPIKVSDEDEFPNFVCLECLGVLQAMDDLAYRAYLVEVCLRRYSRSAGVIRAFKTNDSSEQKENIKTVSAASLESHRQGHEDEDSSHDAIDCNLLIPEVNLLTSSVPLQLRGDVSQTDNKVFLNKKSLKMQLNEVQCINLQRNLSWHSYAKPFDEETDSDVEVSDSLGEESPVKMKANKHLQTPNFGKIVAPSPEKVVPDVYIQNNPIEKEKTTIEKTHFLSKSIRISGAEETHNAKNVALSQGRVPGVSLHSYAKPARNVTELKLVSRKTVQPLSELIRNEQTYNDKSVALSEDETASDVRFSSDPKPLSNAIKQNVVLQERAHPLSKFLVFSKETDCSRNVQKSQEEIVPKELPKILANLLPKVDPIASKVVPVANLHSYAKPMEDVSEKKVVSKGTAQPLSELMKIGNTNQVVSMEKFNKLISDITSSAKAEFGEKSSQAAGKKKKQFILKISKIDKKSGGELLKATPSPEMQKVTFPPQVTQKKHGPLFIHGCYICNKKFGQYQHLLSHMQVSHSASDKLCPVCEKVFDQASIQPLLSHRKIHSEAELKKWTIGSEIKTNFKCDTCRKFFISRIHKIYHDIYHHQLSLYCCEFCEAECFSAVSLEKHRKICGASSESFEKTCFVCAAVFKSLTDFQQHIQGHEERYTCDYCFTSFTSSRLLEDHVQIDHAEKPYSCEQCGKSFVIEPILTQHQKSFHPVIPVLQKMSDTSNSRTKFGCAACDQSFPSRAKLKQHRKTHNYDKKRKCIICKEVFRSVWEMKTHRCREHGQFTCNICRSSCCSLEEFNNHIAHCAARHEKQELEHEGKCKNVSSIINRPQKKRKRRIGKSIQCETCGRKFSDKCQLRSHESIHTGERPYMCAVCGKTFRTKVLHFTHSKRHTDVNHYKCPFCDLKFRRMDQLYMHKRVKHLERFKYHCKVCNRSYMSHKYYIMHMQMCTTFDQLPKEFEDRSVQRCLLCPQFFRSDLTLKKHESRMHDLNHPPICGFCFEKFPNVISLKRHLEVHYNNNEIKNIDCPNCNKTWANSQEFRIHLCVKGLNSADSNPESGNENSTSDPTHEEAVPTIRQAGNTEEESNSKEDNTRDLAGIPIPKSLENLVLGSNEAASLNENVDILDRTKFTTECKQNSTCEYSTQQPDDETIFTKLPETKVANLVTEEPSLNNSQNTNENEEQAGDSISIELMSNLGGDMIYQCSFCETDFYDNNIFLVHLKHEHNLELDSLNFQFQE